MARLGAIIVCIDLNETTNNETVRMVQDEGNVAFGFQCDVSDNAQVQAVSAQGGCDNWHISQGRSFCKMQARWMSRPH